jgi:hypothetical protein
LAFLAQHYSSHRIEMQIAAHLQQIFFGLMTVLLNLP